MREHRLQRLRIHLGLEVMPIFECHAGAFALPREAQFASKRGNRELARSRQEISFWKLSMSFYQSNL
jgi:hypothetical protein